MVSPYYIINTVDPFTLEPVSDIPLDRVFDVRIDDKAYRYDALSLARHIIVSKTVQDPLSRRILTNDEIIALDAVIKKCEGSDEITKYPLLEVITPGTDAHRATYHDVHHAPDISLVMPAMLAPLELYGFTSGVVLGHDVHDVVHEPTSVIRIHRVSEHDPLVIILPAASITPTPNYRVEIFNSQVRIHRI